MTPYRRYWWGKGDWCHCRDVTSNDCRRRWRWLSEYYDLGRPGLKNIESNKNYITKSAYFNGYKKPGDTQLTPFPFHAFMEVIRQKLPKNKINEIMNTMYQKPLARIEVRGRYGYKSQEKAAKVRLIEDSFAFYSEPVTQTSKPVVSGTREDANLLENV